MPSQHADLYVVRLLPEGRQPTGCTPCDAPARFGFSQPCVRCLRALEILGVHRVIYSTGGADDDGEIGCEVREVSELLADARENGHCSRGDKGAVASGAVRRNECE
jgi:tRNA(Arg) A34 adenosine deaminase TadA